MSGYNCAIEYISNTENICADLLSNKSDNGYAGQEEESYVVDIIDNTFEVGVRNSNEIDSKEFAYCRVPKNGPLKEPDTEFVGFDTVLDQAKDKEILGFKTIMGNQVKLLRISISLSMICFTIRQILMTIQVFVCA